MLAGGVATNVELGYRSKDGPPRHIVWNGLLKDGLIDPYGRDVTHERARAADLARAQDALPQAENRLSPTSSENSNCSRVCLAAPVLCSPAHPF